MFSGHFIFCRLHFFSCKTNKTKKTIQKCVFQNSRDSKRSLSCVQLLLLPFLEDSNEKPSIFCCILLYVNMFYYLLVGFQWLSVFFIEFRRCSLIFVDVHWFVLMFSDVQWFLLIFNDFLWCSLILHIFTDFYYFRWIHICSLIYVIFYVFYNACLFQLCSVISVPARTRGKRSRI